MCYDSPLISGSLAVFYPCRVKETVRIGRILSLWKQRRQKQIRAMHSRHHPLTELMDTKWVKAEMDDCLNRVFLSSSKARQYATKCIQKEYEENREGKQHSKETNIVISRFQMTFPWKRLVENGSYDIEKIPVNGLLIFSLNLDNLVGTFIVNLNFEHLAVDQVIFLKHIFYKRYTVSISQVKCFKRCNSKCDDVCKLKHRHFSCAPISNLNLDNITIPEFVISQSDFIWHKLKWNIDFRARYSLLEIDQNVTDCMAYGLINADEGYRYVPRNKIELLFTEKGKGTNISTRSLYSYYISGQNGLIINSENNHLWECLQIETRRFFEQGHHQSYHNTYYPPELMSCIAGVGKGRFKTFLKAVELHYLVNAATTNEIEIRQQSHVNPFVFLRRAYRLWEIIYEIDMNPYHRDQDINDRFGTTEKVSSLKEEYKSILNLTIGYATILIAIFTLAFTILQLCR